MIADSGRVDAFARAIQKAVQPGCLCLELGTGTRFFAVLACRAGARRVVAIEPNPAIHVAKEVAAENGCADRITFIQDLSTRVKLEEPADVIVSDMGGVLPLYGHNLLS